jgi:hypothetical protein
VAFASLLLKADAGTVTFGGSGGTFDMVFVTVGDPGNAPDTRTAARPISATLGQVDYTYEIGKFEVSGNMIDKYNANFGTANSLEIVRTNYTPDKPAMSISWTEAARFVNWLNTSQGYQAAYRFAVGSNILDNIQLWTSGEAGYNASNKYRNSLAKYVLPDYNEWYKAAYYKGGSLNAGYWTYTTGSDDQPVAVASGTGTGVNGNNEAVYGSKTSPADVDKAGGLSP